MLKKSLSLMALMVCAAVFAGFGLFAALEQGPPGPVNQELEHAYISTTDIGLAGGIAFAAAAALGIIALAGIKSDRLCRFIPSAGRLKALYAHLNSAKTYASTVLARFFQPHVTTSRSVRTS